MGTTLVIAETFGGKLRKSNLNAITFARTLAAKTGGDFAIALVGSGVSGLAGELAGYGAKAIHVVDHPGLAQYLAAPWAKVVATLADEIGATAVAAASTTFSRDLLPRIAARLGAGMVSEVLSVVGEGAEVRFTRPMWAGNVVATVAVKTPRMVFGVRGTEFDAAQPTGGASPVQTHAIVPENDGRQRYIQFSPVVSSRPDLGEAAVVVAGGRGLKDAQGFALLDPLADLLKAAIGATRAVVDAGIAPNDLQIGQTGKVIAPQLYIGVALSGAIQHLAGMKNSKVIVAINKDPEAPIFSIADYGLVADAFKAVPELVEQIRKVKGL
ncbi:electron transfer flavoprotein subunit alpha/FixB family protein [Myxococcota bacterium]|jgi:electron transfer flavoprotein alpha subunit|nr:electron transfer flavoprotein subunit alpha/FixB family protein [Myxococcota bacterium]